MEEQELRDRLQNIENKIDAIGNMIYYEILGNPRTEEQIQPKKSDSKKHNIKIKEEKEV